MWTEFINMTVPALVGSVVTFAGIVLSNRLKKQKLEFDVDIDQLEKKNSELLEELRDYRAQEQ